MIDFNIRKIVALCFMILCSSFSVHAQEHAAVEVIVDTVSSKIISYPSYKIPEGESGKKKSGRYDGLSLTGVELRDTATVVSFKFSNLLEKKGKSDTWCSIANDSFLVTIKGGKYTYYELLWAEGIAIAPEKTKLTRGESVEFKLFFEPLPEGTETFNMCEPCGWDIGDINLSASNSRESQQVGNFNLKQYLVYPTFQGGDINRLASWFSERTKYPAVCRRAKLEETIYLKLTVSKDGTISAKLRKGRNQAFIDEALRVASMLPPMTPGSVYGRNCVMTYNFPVIFRFQKSYPY